MAVRRLPNGRFARVITVPEAIGRAKPRAEGGNLVIQVRTNSKEIAAVARELRTRVGTTILSDADQRADAIQTRLRAAILGTYTKAATGRMSRGIFAKATKTGTPEGGIQTVIRVTMFNYREANFITNLGGRGYFQRFPVGPYRIFAKGAEGVLDFVSSFRKKNTIRSGRQTIAIVKNIGVGRLKVPRKSTIFTASRQPGRGGGESRGVPDMQIGERGANFFYPLWVNHPGFPEDVISQVALEEGARFTAEIKDKVAAVSTDIPVVKPVVSFKGGGFVYHPMGPGLAE